MTLEMMLNSAINGAFVGLGVALGASVYELWIKPHIKRIHRKTNRIQKHIVKQIRRKAQLRI